MEDRAWQAMAVEIERNAGRISAHERECAVRYGAINDTMAGMKKDVTDVKTALEALVKREDGESKRLSKLQITVLGALVAAMISVIGWMGGQLYALEPLRHLAPATAPKP